MKIGIIGGGSIGLLIASYLAEYHEITIYVRRQEQKQELNKHGIIETRYARKHVVNALLLEEMESQEEEVLLLCVKQYHLANLLPVLAKVSEQTAILFLQNGMGHVDFAKKLTHPVYFGVVNHGALRDNDYGVLHTGKGNISVAKFKGTDHELCLLVNQLNQKHFPVQAHDDWQELLSIKLVVNAVINPLTALFDVPNGEILKNTNLLHIAKELCREAVLTLDLDYKKTWTTVHDVALNTHENISSMLKDLRENRLTEIDAISGFIIKHRKSNTPYTQFVYYGIKALEVKKGINV